MQPKPLGYETAPTLATDDRPDSDTDDKGTIRIHKDTKKERIENERIKMLFR